MSFLRIYTIFTYLHNFLKQSRESNNYDSEVGQNANRGISYGITATLRCGNLETVGTVGKTMGMWGRNPHL